MFETKSQNGIALYFSLMIVAILLAIALGLSSILLGQLKTIKEMGDSVVAFYAADAGIEEVLMQRNAPDYIIDYLDLNNDGVQDDGDSSYEVVVTVSGGFIPPSGPVCSADNFCIKSIGVYRKTHRAIEITY